jgi:hypothetical protein
MLIEITVCNRGPDSATLHVLPTLWYRNTWSEGSEAPRPVLRQAAGGLIVASHPTLGERFLTCESATALLFTENETNTERLFGAPNRTPYVKDGIDRFIVHGRHDAVNPRSSGTKASAHYPLVVGAGESRRIRLRLEQVAPISPFGSFDSLMEARRNEADEFYASVIPASLDPDAANVMRQALAGMLWSKQFYTTTSGGGSRSTAPARSRAIEARPPATRAGTTCTTLTSFRCRTSGNIPGTRRGIWPSTSSR